MEVVQKIVAALVRLEAAETPPVVVRGSPDECQSVSFDGRSWEAHTGFVAVERFAVVVEVGRTVAALLERLEVEEGNIVLETVGLLTVVVQIEALIERVSRRYRET